MQLAAFYGDIKTLHIVCVALSVSLFTGRGLWRIIIVRPLWRWLRVAPHLVDTLLLASGLTLAFLIQQYPFINSDWLTAKVVGLIVYIGLGEAVFRGPRSAVARVSLGAMALLVFAYIISVAIRKQPAGFLGAWVY